MDKRRPGAGRCRVPKLVSKACAARSHKVFFPVWIALLLNMNCWLGVEGDRSNDWSAPAHYSPGSSPSLVTTAKSFDPGQKPIIPQWGDGDDDEGMGDDDWEAFSEHDPHAQVEQDEQDEEQEGPPADVRPDGLVSDENNDSVLDMPQTLEPTIVENLDNPLVEAPVGEADDSLDGLGQGTVENLATDAVDGKDRDDEAFQVNAPSPSTIVTVNDHVSINGMPEDREDLDQDPASATDFTAYNRMPNFYADSLELGKRYHKTITRAGQQVAGTKAAASSLLDHSQRYESSLETLSANLQAFNVGVKHFREVTAKKHGDNTKRLADSLQKGLQDGIDAWPTMPEQ